MKKLFENWRKYCKAEFEYHNAKELWEFKLNEPEDMSLAVGAWIGHDDGSSLQGKGGVASDEIMKKAHFNTLLAMDVFDDDATLSESNEHLMYQKHSPEEPNEEVVKAFETSLYSGERSGFLTYYQEDELAKMKLFLIKGYQAGFAIKDGDDIVAVHNNTKGKLRGLSSKFMEDAKAAGGAKLDHFDGFLSGNYRKYGFTKVYDVWDWNGRYRSDAWDYPPTDIFNQKTSVYYEALGQYVDDIQSLPVAASEYKLESGFVKTFEPMGKYYSYKNGMPDVIFRKL